MTIIIVGAEHRSALKDLPIIKSFTYYGLKPIFISSTEALHLGVIFYMVSYFLLLGVMNIP